MQQSFDAMTTALRVLKAVTEKHLPDPADIAALRDLAGPQPEDIDVDELACEVIQTALKRRAAAREVRRRLEHPGLD
jgi:hypothetical protein